ncbi:MAG: ribosome silencing factor [Chloroflexi bacterium]|nr:ribosome silencing factor [Chloroflexota bacterium]
MSSQALAKQIVEIAEDKQASDIVMLDIRPLSIIADYFIICSGTSERQLTAINREIVDTLRREVQRKPLHTEGRPDSGWVVLDYGEVIVHIFAPLQRRLYELEALWSEAVPVVRIQ